MLPALAGDLCAQQPDASAKRRVIVFVWDGLRAQVAGDRERASSSPTITRSIRPSR